MTPWQATARSALGELRTGVSEGIRLLITDTGGELDIDLLDSRQEAAYHLAFLASEGAAIDIMIEYSSGGALEERLARVAVADLFRSARSRLLGRWGYIGFGADPLAGSDVEDVVRLGSDTELLESIAHELPADGTGPRHLPEDLALAAQTFRRFSDEQIVPRADQVHRRTLDVPEEIISGLAELGVFGLSVPTRYGGSQTADEPEMLAMVVVTEELTRGSLAVGGSLITRSEIFGRALMNGGTEEQKKRWLPMIASGEAMVAVAVTEPGHGSDVAGIQTRAKRHGEHYLLAGTKTWCTFAGRAELLMVLARTDPDPSAGHRGLSLFVIEKQRFSGRQFTAEQEGGGRMTGRAIPTIGYRGLHSFEIAFDEWAVPATALVGGPRGEGRGFYLQMEGFSAGRLQTAARAVGLMEAAFGAALRYAGERVAFGKPIAEFGLTKARLARMAARIQANRQFAYRVAEQFRTRDASSEASMVKILSCRAAEEVTRDAMQIHGGNGYAEEFSVSRYFVDARVLSIFEGAEEPLALRVIARRLAQEAVDDA